MIQRARGSVLNVQDSLGYLSLGDIAGAAGDGVTDNTAFLNTALASGLPVYIPPGTWLVTPITVPANTTIFGAGRASILKLKTGSIGSVLTIGSNTSIQLIGIDGNKTGQSSSLNHGIAIVNAVLAKVGLLTISNTIGDGINVSGATTTDIKIIDCNITGFVKTGITVESGNLVYISGCHISISDVAAIPGDGIAIAPTLGPSLLYGIVITGCTSRNLTGRAVAIVGFGSRNVHDITINGLATSSNNSHGVHIINANRVMVANASVRSCTGDGYRIEGDVQYSRISECTSYANTGTSFREIVAGLTPNNNGFIYNVANNNGSDIIVKVGAASFIV
jgi:hypothetical protein